ncbi:MAG: type IX secretion system membrane protein PorP/SprF [Candidatus Azobacteroides sp.]|nr:type IX secretion system membrane protein PorP/SprF [Candidatus Azobacteroides sp.]
MKKLPLLFVCLLCVSGIKAQFDAQFSQYWAVENYFNPAKAGSELNKINLTALYNMQWLGMPGAPKTTFITAEAGINLFERNHGVGASFYNEKIGLYSLSTFAAQYAFKIKLFEGIMSFGLEAGLFNLSFDGGGLYSPSSDYHNSSDPGMPTGNEKGSKLNVNFGMRYSTKNYYVGVSSTKLTEPVIEFNDLISTYVGRVYYLTAGGNIQMSNLLYQIRPSFLVKSDFLTTQIDLTARVFYNEFLWGGLSYRWNEALIFAIGAEIRNIRFGYAYDYSTTAIAKVSSGSHEITLSYTMDLNLSKNNRYKYKSVRVL